MRVRVRLGRRFSQEAGFAERAFEVPAGATAVALLEAVGKAAPGLSCVDAPSRVVDLALANLSVNGRAVDPLRPGDTRLHDGDEAYLYGTVSGG